MVEIVLVVVAVAHTDSLQVDVEDTIPDVVAVEGGALCGSSFLLSGGPNSSSSVITAVLFPLS